MSEDTQGMKIVELRAENVKRVRAVQMQVGEDGGLIVIGGKNDQGKTSVLDSILYALGGARTIPERPLREGAEKGEVELTLKGEDGAEYHVTRTFTESNTYLCVEDANGREFKSPQSMLDGFLGELSFDPLAFARMSASEQREALMDATGLREELKENEQKIEEAYENRREARRELKRLQNKLDGEEKPDAPDEPVDKSLLMSKLREAREQKEENEAVRRELDEVNDRIRDKQKAISSRQDEIKELEQKLKRLRNEIRALKEEQEDLEQERGTLRGRVKDLDDPDIEAIEDEIEEADDIEPPDDDEDGEDFSTGGFSFDAAGGTEESTGDGEAAPDGGEEDGADR